MAWPAAPAAGAAAWEAADPFAAPEFDVPVLPLAPLADEPLVAALAPPVVAAPLAAPFVPPPVVAVPFVAPLVDPVPPGEDVVAPPVLAAAPEPFMALLVAAVPGCDGLALPVTPGFALDPVPVAAGAAVPLIPPLCDPDAAAPPVPPCPAAPDAAPAEPADPPAAPAPPPPPAPAAKPGAHVAIKAAAVKRPIRRNDGRDMFGIRQSVRAKPQ